MNTPPVSTPIYRSKRDSSGRWKLGTSGNPKGRPPIAQEIEYLRRTRENCTPDEWGVIVARAKRDALNGDRHARAFLAPYLLPPRDESNSLLETEEAPTAGVVSVQQLIARIGKVRGVSLRVDSESKGNGHD